MNGLPRCIGPTDDDAEAVVEVDGPAVLLEDAIARVDGCAAAVLKDAIARVDKRAAAVLEDAVAGVDGCAAAVEAMLVLSSLNNVVILLSMMGNTLDKYSTLVFTLNM